ncbi:MAG: hypothetical protein ABIN80_26430 [Dyadobacter sp.]
MEKFLSLFDIMEVFATVSMSMLGGLVAYGLWICFTIDSHTQKN